MAFLRTTIDSTNLDSRSLAFQLVLADISVLGEGYVDMKTTEDEIRSFVEVLADNPQEVAVKRINGNPIVFEIAISKKDVAEVSSKQKAIQAIAGYASGLGYSQFVIKILET